MARTLLIVDIQNDYFDGGAMPLVGADRAVAAAEGVLASFRRAGDPVVHVLHIWDDPEAVASFRRSWSASPRAAARYRSRTAVSAAAS